MSTTPDTQPSQPEPASASSRLSPSEIESLQRDKAATLAYATARFREMAAQDKPERLTPSEVESLQADARQTVSWARERARQRMQAAATGSPLPVAPPAAGRRAPRP